MSKGAVSLMTMIIQDLEDEIVNDGKAEAKSQADYEASRDTAQKLKESLEDKKVNLENIIANKGESKTDEKKDLADNEGQRDDELKYKSKIKPDCDWILKNFDGRTAARAAEMDGLTSAKEFLAGKASLLKRIWPCSWLC